MSRSGTLSRNKSLLHRLHFCCHRISPPRNNDLVVIFIFLVGIELLVVVFPLHVYFFVLVYFFPFSFPPPPPPATPPATKTMLTASRQIPIPIPLIPLLNNDSLILPCLIIRNPLHLLRGHNVPPHDLITTSLPAYPVWRNWLWP